MQISSRCRSSWSKANAASTTTLSAIRPCPARALVDPVADRAALHRAAHDVVEVDLAGQSLVDEDAEAVGQAGGASRSRAAQRAMKASRFSDGSSCGGRPPRLPRREPGVVAAAAPRSTRGSPGRRAGAASPAVRTAGAATGSCDADRRVAGHQPAADSSIVTVASCSRRITATTRSTCQRRCRPAAGRAPGCAGARRGSPWRGRGTRPPRRRARGRRRDGSSGRAALDRRQVPRLLAAHVDVAGVDDPGYLADHVVDVVRHDAERVGQLDRRRRVGVGELGRQQRRRPDRHAHVAARRARTGRRRRDLDVEPLGQPARHPPADRVVAAGEVPGVVGVQALDPDTSPADPARSAAARRPAATPRRARRRTGGGPRRSPPDRPRPRRGARRRRPPAG